MPGHLASRRIAIASRRLATSTCLLAIGYFAQAGESMAGNGDKLRVPVIWASPPTCIADLDRAVTTSLPIGYDFAGEDDVPPVGAADELPDSRRHQFFALCRDRVRTQPLPTWPDAQELARADAAGLAPIDPPSRTVLSEAAPWQDCALTITPNDARLPITHAQASLGTTWDISTVATGTYIVEALTWEPPVNRWTHPPRPGVVRVYDSRLEQPTPAAAFTDASLIAYRDDLVELHACAAYNPGSTLSAAWAIAPLVGQEPQWQAMAAPIPAATPGQLTLALDQAALLAAAGPTFKLLTRIDIVDPLGRSYTAYSREEIVVINQDRATDTTSTQTIAQDDDGGCSIAARPGFGAGAALFAIVAAIGSRRRKSTLII